MKITFKNENLFKISDAQFSSFLMSFVFVAIGIWFFGSQLSAGSLIFKIGALAFVGFGLYFFLNNEISNISIDKTTQKILIGRRKVFSLKNEEYFFKDLSKIILREISGTTSGRSSGRTVSYDIQLVLNNGQRVSFVNNSSTVSPMFAGKSKHVEIAKEIAVFIGVPYEEFMNPSLGEMFGAFKQVLDLAAQGKIKTVEDLKIDNLNKK